MEFNVTRYASLWCPQCKVAGDIFGPLACPECGAPREPRGRFADLERDLDAFLEFALDGNLGIDEGGMLAAVWGERSPLAQFLRPGAAALLLQRFVDGISPGLLGSLRELSRGFQDSKAFASSVSKAIKNLERKRQDVGGVLKKLEDKLLVDPVTDLNRRYGGAYDEHRKAKRDKKGGLASRSDLDTLLLERDELKDAFARVSVLRDNYAKFQKDFANIPMTDLPVSALRGDAEFTALFTAIGRLVQPGGAK